MPDITMCKDSGCEKRYDCFRYMAKPSGRQSYFADKVRKDSGYCEYQSMILGSERMVLSKDEMLATEKRRKENN